MDFTEVIVAHVAWKQRLERYVGGDRTEALNVEQIGLDTRCALGQWIYGEGARFAACEEYLRVKEKHALFHKMAATIVQQCDSGDIAAARQTLESDYSRISEHVKRDLVRLARRIAAD